MVPDSLKKALNIDKIQPMKWQLRTTNGNSPERDSKTEAVADLNRAIETLALRNIPRTKYRLEIWVLHDSLSIWRCVHRIEFFPRPQEGRL